jgi:hypothetical protein
MSNWQDDPFANGRGYRPSDAEPEDVTAPDAWTHPRSEQPGPALDRQALYGPAGDVVKTIEPETESDPAAVLLQLLTAAGNAIGRGPHYRVEGDRHFTNLFCLLIGWTALARKGTSWERVRQVMRPADSDWDRHHVVSGLSTGEGLIWRVRDSRSETKADPKSGDLKTMVVDEGVADKRLLVVEAEFVRVLAAAKRDSNTLSPVLREAWDGRSLGILTKASAATATEPHIGVIAHITCEELRRVLDDTAICNGFVNRFLLACVRRSRSLPFGGNLDGQCVIDLGGQLQRCIERARNLDRLKLDNDACRQWAVMYDELGAEKPGLYGAATARSAAQTIRLATLYAALDGVDTITGDHLGAALALWRYCSDSARYVLGDFFGDPVADDILRSLRASPDGMTRTEVRELFARNKPSGQIGAALGVLLRYGLVRCQTKGSNGGGRPATVWFAA